MRRSAQPGSTAVMTLAMLCLLPLTCIAAGQSAESPAAAIRSDAHHLAADVKRETHIAGHQVANQAHRLHRQMLVTRERLSQQLHQLGQRFRRWWGHVRQT